MSSLTREIRTVKSSLDQKPHMSALTREIRTGESPSSPPGLGVPYVLTHQGDQDR